MCQICHRLFAFAFTVLTIASCAVNPASNDSPASGAASDLRVIAYRVRADASLPINTNRGWAAQENQPAQLFYDAPFRLRFQVRADSSGPEGHVLGLQYRRQGGSWLPLGVSDFPYPAFATPESSVITTTAYAHGAETERLLGDSATDWDDGAGLNGIANTPVWKAVDEALEWEWPLVIRRFSDGPGFAEDGTVFEFRVVDGYGRAVPGREPIAVTVRAATGHLGGTFIETPGRLGPYQNEEGHLYFFMEPSETDNRFMAVRSTDFGVSWREVDGPNRPRADDLEGVAATRVGSTVHLLHQVTEEVFYHAFELGDGESPGEWRVDSESIATPAEPPTQYAALAARSDASLVAFYGGPRELYLQIRSAEGRWSQPAAVGTHTSAILSGPVLASGPGDVVSLAYTAQDGRGYVRHYLPDGSLTPAQLISTNLGTQDPENGAILPLVIFPQTGTTAIVYREADGFLYERRLSRERQLSPAVRISEHTVVSNAVDSEQAGADLVRYGTSLHLLFIDADTGSIYHTQADRQGNWRVPRAVVENIQGSWVRGSIHSDASRNPVYGFVYDAGSQGGSGFNRYFALPL